MKQKWKKLGRIFCPTGEKKWLNSHASVPIAEYIEDDLFRIFFSSRDTSNRSYTGSLILDINKPQTIIDLSLTPSLSPGKLGEFDDSGAMATWLAIHNNNRYLYYIGWNLGVTVPFRNSIGLAISSNKTDFSKYSNGPIIDRSITEPHFCASCCVIPENDRWRMWYLSCTEWKLKNNKPTHRYHLKYAESNDGISWKRDGVVAIDYNNEKEYAISRPSVIRDKDKWRMWFSTRGTAYKIGYAESQDGIKWKRLDDYCGISVSQKGWDSDMIEYPFVFDHKNKRFMLYNGNDYGKSGFGLAVLED